jgi:hypothetical protein
MKLIIASSQLQGVGMEPTHAAPLEVEGGGQEDQEGKVDGVAF